MGPELDENNDGECDGNNFDAVDNFEYVNDKNNGKLLVPINNTNSDLNKINGNKNVQMPQKPIKLNKILIVDD